MSAVAHTTKIEEERARADARRRELDAELGRIVRILEGIEDVELAIVFGSHARGETSLSSDLDLIVVRRDEQPFVDRLGALWRLLQPRVEVDLLVYTPHEFEELRETRYFVAKAVEEGKVLLDRREGRK